MSKTKVIAIMNHKGGSGKTTSVISIATSLAIDKGYKVLLVDGDMQKNLTMSFNLEDDSQKNFYKVMKERESVKEYILKTDYENIDIVIADENMATIEMDMVSEFGREHIVKECLEEIIEEEIYDFIIFDTNPTLALLNFNILNAADYLLVPVEATAFGIKGLQVLMKFFKRVKKYNPKLDIGGIFLTNVDNRRSITKEARDIVVQVFAAKRFSTEIAVDANVGKSQWNQVPLTLYNSNSRASKQYKELTEELLSVMR